ncbi:MAG: hypothetical protein QOE22_694 [Candidatus Parcubacteria bacterium]|nr:hypothetical protein [Candidatus Parcubacteria bacterium]
MLLQSNLFAAEKAASLVSLKTTVAPLGRILLPEFLIKYSLKATEQVRFFLTILLLVAAISIFLPILCLSSGFLHSLHILSPYLLVILLEIIQNLSQMLSRSPQT